MIVNPVVSGGSVELAICSLSNETKFASETFYFVGPDFEVESVSVAGYESKSIEVPVETIFCYSSSVGAISIDLSGGAVWLEDGIFKITGDFSIRIFQ